MIVRIWYEPAEDNDEKEIIDISVKMTLIAVEDLIGYIPPYNLHGRKKKILNVGCLSQLDGNRVYEMVSKEVSQGIIQKIKLVKNSQYETKVGNFISTRPEPIRNPDGTFNLKWMMDNAINSSLQTMLKMSYDYAEKDNIGKITPITRAVALYWMIMWKDELTEDGIIEDKKKKKP